jgi:hypothetical protein
MIKADTDPRERWARIDRLLAAYQPGVVADGVFVSIAFLGAWDTVGVLGVPTSLGYLRILGDLGGDVLHCHNTATASTCARTARGSARRAAGAVRPHPVDEPGRGRGRPHRAAGVGPRRPLRRWR